MERLLPTVTISEVVILAQSALWRQRTPQENDNKRRENGQESSAPAPASVDTILVHLLSLHRTLWDLGTTQVAEGAQDWVSGQDDAQKITAVLRRALPALRIASKWTRANIAYLHETTERVAVPRQRDRESILVRTIKDAWLSLTKFAQVVHENFPLASLPTLTGALEEDVDLIGFLPIHQALGGSRSPTGSDANLVTWLTSNDISSTGGVHPNVEQLMRMRDLLMDIQYISRSRVRFSSFLSF
jgi:protein SMG7